MAILLNHPALIFARTTTSQDGRTIAADITIYTTTLHVVNIYAPVHIQNNKRRQENQLFLKNLYPFIKSNHPTILAGDFNTVDDPTIDRFPPQRPRYQPTELQDICTTYQLTDAYRTLHNNTSTYTWRNATAQSRLDRIYISPCITPTQYNAVCNPLSDHDTVSVSLTTHDTSPRGRGSWKNNAAIYKEESFQKELSEQWNNWKNTIPKYNTDITQWWKHVKRKIKALTIRHSTLQAQKHKAEQTNLQQKLETLKSQICKHPDKYKAYQTTKNTLSKLIRTQAKQKLFKHLAEDHHNNLSTKAFYQQFEKQKEQTTIPSLKDETGQEMNTPANMMKIAEKYYNELYFPKETKTETQQQFLDALKNRLPSDDQHLIEKEISNTEIEIAVKSMKNGKTPGPDGLSAELYALCWDVIGEDFTKVIKQLYETGLMPAQMKEGNITLIHKKGDRSTLTNYRPISLLNTDYKIFNKILATRIRTSIHTVISPQQYAKPGTQIQEATTVIRDLHWTAKQRNKNAYFISLDFQKAFDSIDQNWLTFVLKKMDYPNKFIKMVQNVQLEATSKILINGFLSEKIQIRRGVRQSTKFSSVLNSSRTPCQYDYKKQNDKGNWSLWDSRNKNLELCRRHDAYYGRRTFSKGGP